METEVLVKLAKQIAKPAYVAMWVLAGLLVLSIAGNIYLATRHNEIILEQDNTDSNFNINAVTK